MTSTLTSCTVSWNNILPGTLEVFSGGTIVSTRIRGEGAYMMLHSGAYAQNVSAIGSGGVIFVYDGAVIDGLLLSNATDIAAVSAIKVSVYSGGTALNVNRATYPHSMFVEEGAVVTYV